MKQQFNISTKNLTTDEILFLTELADQRKLTKWIASKIKQDQGQQGMNQPSLHVQQDILKRIERLEQQIMHQQVEPVMTSPPTHEWKPDSEEVVEASPAQQQSPQSFEVQDYDF